MQLLINLSLAFAWTVATALSAVVADPYSAPRVTFQDLRLQQKICSHPLYCEGPILRRIQLGGVFDSDKTFIDMPTRKPVSQVVDAFNKLPANATRDDLAKFVSDNFHPAGCDIKQAELDDWTDDPPFLKGVTDPVLRGYGMALHNQWKGLARQRNTDFLCDGCETSLLPVKHTFIVGGANSTREPRYWDTYYIVLGLLKSGLNGTARGMLQNLLDLVGIYGFVPTGGRIYFTDRSEPPLLALMVKNYYEATLDLDFVARALPMLKAEHKYWDTYRSINVTYTRSGNSSLSRRQSDLFQTVTSKTTLFGPSLFQTAVQSASDESSDSEGFLRPESYSTDYSTFKTQFAAANLFSTAIPTDNLYAATEAGTAPSVQYASVQTAMAGPSLFSTSLRRRDVTMPDSNPFAAFTKNELSILGSININSTIATNLNSIMYQVEVTIANFISLLNNKTDTAECTSYRQRASERRQTLLDLSYNPSTGLFSDFHLTSGQQTDVWSVNSLWPYWAFGDSLPAESAQKAIDSISKLHKRFSGGLPNTLYNTTLNWDYPKIQPPLQHMIVQSVLGLQQNTGLTKRSSAATNGFAVSLVQNSIDAAFCNWYTTGGDVPGVLNQYEGATGGSTGMNFEFYSLGDDGDITTTTSTAGQGDYTWTNGVMVWLLGQFSSQVTTPTCPNIVLNLVRNTTVTPTLPPVVTPTPSPSSTCGRQKKCSTNCRCIVRRRGVF
ncbi:hypothetical protein IW146_003653 [Coemansia sp. RSA 922]|nr:hypothetical protein H4S04_004921 [Coemansia sp. S16]KAJ2113719.1 hypothetical protein IW146_003653 [Coemansia sp. RSA 922]